MTKKIPDLPVNPVCGCQNAQAKAASIFEEGIAYSLNEMGLCPTAIIHGMVWALLRLTNNAGLPNELQTAFTVWGDPAKHMMNPDDYLEDDDTAQEVPVIIPAPGGSGSLH